MALAAFVLRFPLIAFGIMSSCDERLRLMTKV
jgi:hypothetical protein